MALEEIKAKWLTKKRWWHDPWEMVNAIEWLIDRIEELEKNWYASNRAIAALEEENKHSGEKSS